MYLCMWGNWKRRRRRTEAVIHNELVSGVRGKKRKMRGNAECAPLFSFPPSLTPSVGEGFSSPCWEWGGEEGRCLRVGIGGERRRRRRSYHLFPWRGIPQVNKLSLFNVQSSLYGKWLFYPLVCLRLANYSQSDISPPFLPPLKRGQYRIGGGGRGRVKYN